MCAGVSCTSFLCEIFASVHSCLTSMSKPSLRCVCVCARNAFMFNIPPDILLLDMAGTARTVTRVCIKTEGMIVVENVRPKLPECPLLPACNVDHKSML